jgi:RNA polymerase sigma-70 factor (ECF subfamily)
MSAEAHIRALIEQGDLRGAATEAIRGLGPPVVRYLRSLLRDEDDAAEAFSRFSEKLWKGLPGFQQRSSLRTWMYRLAWTAAVDLKREPYRRRRARLSEASSLADEVRTGTPVVEERNRRALDLLRAELSVEDQCLLALRIDQELPWAEVAEVLAVEGAPVEVPALQKRFERLRDRIARLARDQGLVE